MGMDPLNIGLIPPSPDLVTKFFNDSTGEGDLGESDLRGPWNQGDVEFVEAPAKPVAEGTADEVTEEIHKAVSRTGTKRNRRK